MIESFREIAEIIKYKELLRNLVAKDIKIRYKRSVIGFFWVMLHPLLMMIILSMVFSEIFKMSGKNYSVYILSGITVWNLFSQSTSTSITSFTGNRDLIKKIYLPKSIFPLSVSLSALIHFVFSLIPLFVIILISGTSMSYRIFMLPVILLSVMLFCYGISLIVSTATVFFHDTKYIYDVLLIAGMYMTPIFYPESIIPARYTFIIYLNPLSYFLSAFRSAVYMDGQNMPEKLLYGVLFSLVTFIAGWLFYDRFKDRIVYYL
jgi:homopolymeric O-antigen transport system permease protein